MKQLNLWVLLVGLNLMSMLCLGQARPTPSEVTSNFNKMFPDALDVQWKDKINNFAAFFNIKGVRCEAKFATTGSWISTEEAIQWEGTSAYILQLSGGVTQYHIVVTKSDQGRKILFFNPNGQLLADH